MAIADAEYERVLREELDRRIADISSTPPSTFGLIGTIELLVAALVCMALPASAFWFFR